MKKEFDIEDVWLPLEIHPETPKEGMPITELFPASSVERMFDNLKNTAKHYGIDFKGNSLLSNSHLALAAGEFAKEEGKFEAFHEKLFYAYFTQSLDIGDIEVLSSICTSIGLDQEKMTAQLTKGTYEAVLNETQESAHQYGISSTPTFVINNKYAIVGAQPLETFRKVLLDLEK